MNIENNVVNLLNNVTIGIFTLAASLGTVWLKDYLEIKKSSKITVKQKAIEAYTLTNQLTFATIPVYIECRRMVANKKIKIESFEFPHKFRNIVYEILERLALLILEDLYTLKEDFELFRDMVVDRLSYLLSVPFYADQTDSNLEILSKLDESQGVFLSEITLINKKIQEILINNYINRNPSGILSFIATSIKNSLW